MVKCNPLQILCWLCFAADFVFSWNIPESTELAVNLGENVTLPCFPHGEPGDVQVMWVKEDRSERLSQWMIQRDGSLTLPNVARDDSGKYTCALESLDASEDTEALSGHALVPDEEAVRSRYRLTVRTTPGELVNVSVHPSTVLALLMWEVGDIGNCEISHFTAHYKLTHAIDWLDVMPRHISPSAVSDYEKASSLLIRAMVLPFSDEGHNFGLVMDNKLFVAQRQIDVYHLSPNSTYTFQIWAINDVGPGAKVSLETTTKHVVQEIELARHLLQGVETFDTRVWVAAVAVVMGTLLVLSIGTCYLMFRDYHVSVWSSDDQEIMELVPNIIANPGFLDGPDRIVPDENFNDQPHVAFNSNSIVRPIRV